MNCPHCQSSSTREQEGRIVQGFRRFGCQDCRRRFNERTGTALRVLFACARRSWRDPAGGSPVREGGSARPVASVAGSSATMVAKRTQRGDEDCIELRKILTVEAEALRTAAGNMRGTVMRGTVAPPEFETSSSRQGSCRNLGDLRPPAAAKAVPGRFGKARSRSRTGRSEESDGCIVPMKPRTTPGRRVEGGERGGKAAGRRKGKGPTHAPDTEPESACPRRPAPTNRNWMGRPSPECRLRLTFDRSPVRESRTPGSARGGRR